MVVGVTESVMGPSGLLEAKYAPCALERNFGMRLALTVEYVHDPVLAARREEGALWVPREDDRPRRVVLGLEGEELFLPHEAWRV